MVLALIIYIICGLINVYGLIHQSLVEGDGSILPTELVAAFLFWWIILVVQIGANIGAMIYAIMGDDDIE